MLVNSFLGWTIIVIISIGAAFLLAWLLFSKLKMDTRYYVLPLGFGMIVGFIIYCKTMTLIVVGADGAINNYTAFWNTSYTSPDGQGVQIRQVEGEDNFIVNCTDKMMALESIHYGESIFIFDFGPTLIPPHTTLSTASEIDYYPYETPPGAVSVQKGTESDTKYWLRYGF